MTLAHRVAYAPLYAWEWVSFEVVIPFFNWMWPDSRSRPDTDPVGSRCSPSVREALLGFFPAENLPTSTWIGVSVLARKDFLIEIEAVAVLE